MKKNDLKKFSNLPNTLSDIRKYSEFFPWFMRPKNSAPSFSKSEVLELFFIDINTIFFLELSSKTNKIFF